MKLNAKFIKKIKNLPIKYILPMLLVMALFVVALPGPMALSAATATPAATAIYNGLGAEDATQGPATIGLNITGQIPTAQTGNSRLNNELEEIWEAQRNAFIQNHMAGALSIHSDAQHFTSYRFVSTVFIKEAVSVSTTAAVSTTVIDSETNQIITLPDFNPNILQLINNHINSLMADGSSNFSGIDANHPFYLDNDRLVIPFGSAELIPTERGIHEIVLSISNIESKSFSSDHFRVLPASQYNTIMIRLSDVMESFGYTVEWYGDARAAVVSLDGITVSIVTIDKNAYHYRDSGIRELEVAPIIYNNLTYVPLSFFNEIVGMPITVSSDGVTVSRYRTAMENTISMYVGFLSE